MLFPNPLLDRLWALNKPVAVFVHSMGPVYGSFLLAFACGTFAAAFGLLHGRRWAWWFAVLLFATDAAGRFASYFLIHDPLLHHYRAIISLGFLYLLCRRAARAYAAAAGQKPKFSAGNPAAPL
jgi:hypothetical protein